MKKVKFYLIFIFVLISFSSINIKATDIKFYDDYSLQILNEINQFRTSNFIDKLFKAGYDLGDLFTLKVPLKECNYCSDFFVDEDLIKYAKHRIVEIIDNKDISHKFISDNNSQYLFSGEGIFILAFQNYINIEKAMEIFKDTIYKASLLRNNPEAVFMYYPYNLIGAAIGTAGIEYEGVKYNIVMLVVESAIKILDENFENKNNSFFGRVYLDGSVCGDCTLGIENLNGVKIGEITTNLDGSFFGSGLPEKFYLTYDGNKIKINLKNFNFEKNIYFQTIDTEK